MSKRLLPVLVAAALIAGTSLALFIPSASAKRTAQFAPTTTGSYTYPFHPGPVRWKVKCGSSYKHGILSLLLALLSGEKASAFQITLPGGTSLSTLKLATLEKYFSVETTGGKTIKYKIVKVTAHSIDIALKTAETAFTFTLNPKVIKYTKHESKLIKSHKVKTITLKLLIAGASHETATSTTKLKV